MDIKWRLMVVLAVGCLAAGCSPLGPQPSYSKFFILSPLSAGRASASQPPAGPTQLAIGVGPIDFPGYLRRPEFVTRVAPNQIKLSPNDRWGEPLDKNFRRVLTQNLSQLLNTDRIHDYPWNLDTRLDYQVAIKVQNFETGSQGQSQLRARWIIKDANGHVLYASETRANTPLGGGDTGPSAALSTDLATLSRAIALQITALNGERADSPPR